MNKCTERVYNGLIKENPTFVLMLVSDTCGYDICNQWSWYGTFNNSCTGPFQYVDFHAT